jgi:hypothetical protein
LLEESQLQGKMETLPDVQMQFVLEVLQMEMVKTIRQNEVVEFAFVLKKDFLETTFLVQGMANVFYFVIKKMEHLCCLQSAGHSRHHTHYSQQVSVCHKSRVWNDIDRIQSISAHILGTEHMTQGNQGCKGYCSLNTSPFTWDLMKRCFAEGDVEVMDSQSKTYRPSFKRAKHMMDPLGKQTTV